eukprot:2251104-Rhodomonas_salina.1
MPPGSLAVQHCLRRPFDTEKSQVGLKTKSATISLVNSLLEKYRRSGCCCIDGLFPTIIRLHGDRSIA